MAAADRDRRRRRLRRHPPRADRRASRPGRAACATSCGSSRRARDFRLLLTTFVLQALATGCMLAGVDYLATDVLGRQGRGDDPVRLLRRPGAAADPGLGARSATRIGKKRGYLLASLVLAAGAALAVLGAVGPGGGGVRRDRAGRRRVRRLPGLPAGDAAGRGGGRRAAYRHRTGPASTPASGPPARRSAWRSGRASSRWCSRSAATGRRPTGDVRPARLRADRDRARLLAAAGRADPGQPGVAAPLLARRRRRSTTEVSRMTDALARLARDAGRPTCRCTAAAPWPTSTTPGCRGRPDRPRGGRGVRRLATASTRPRSRRLLRDGERPGRLRRRPARRARRRRSARVTSGGTESVLLAVQGARDSRPDVERADDGACRRPRTPRSTRPRTTSASRR